MSTTTYEITIVTVQCCRCGIYFGLDQWHMEKLKESRTNFYCPNGHEQYFPGQSMEEKLREMKKELTRVSAGLDWWKIEAEEKARSLTATRGVVTRMKHRIANGVCPCCHRQFAQLEKHMKTKHPEFQTEEVDKL